MVAQKKGGSATKQKLSEAQQRKKALPMKMFAEELPDDDDDDDDEDFDDMENAEMDSDDSDNDTSFKSKSALKTPNTGSKNQASAKSAKKDVHVSFQIQQKTPTSAQKPPKVRTPTPMVPKKQQAANLRQEVLKKGLKEFQGMKGPLATPSTRGKGQIKAPEAAKGGDKSGKRKKMMDEESDDDDEEDDDDDFADDDDDLDEDELDDDDFDGLDDDDEDEDDEEMDSEEEKALVQKAQAFLDKKGKKGVMEQKKAQQQQQKMPKTGQKMAVESVPAKSKDGAQTPKSNQNQSQQKSQAKKERQSPDVSPAKQKKSPLTVESANLDMEQRRKRDVKTLFLKGLPPDVTPEELKSLSPDILSTRIPKPKRYKNSKTGVFAFLEFANEQKAEENFKILQSKKFKGQSLFVDFAGEKSQNRNISSMHTVKEEGKEKNLRKLYVSGMPTDSTIAQVAALFPKAYNIAVSKDTTDVRNASVSFRNEEDAAEALKANTSAKINGKLLTVLYSVEGSKKKRKRTQNKQATGKQQSGPPTKKMRLEAKDDDEGGEDDDDDDSDEE